MILNGWRIVEVSRPKYLTMYFSRDNDLGRRWWRLSVHEREPNSSSGTSVQDQCHFPRILEGGRNSTRRRVLKFKEWSGQVRVRKFWITVEWSLPLELGLVKHWEVDSKARVSPRLSHRNGDFGGVWFVGLWSYSALKGQWWLRGALPLASRLVKWPGRA